MNRGTGHTIKMDDHNRWEMTGRSGSVSVELMQREYIRNADIFQNSSNIRGELCSPL